MFLIQKPRSGDWKVLAASFTALVVAGCTNLGSVPTGEDQSIAAIAIPLQSQGLESDFEPSEYQNFADFEAATYQATLEPAPSAAQEFIAPESARNTLTNFDIEFEAAQAELDLQQQQQAEAEVVAAIEASLQETRRKHNAWYRLQQGM